MRAGRMARLRRKDSTKNARLWRRRALIRAKFVPQRTILIRYYDMMVIWNGRGAPDAPVDAAFPRKRKKGMAFVAPIRCSTRCILWSHLNKKV